MILLIDTSQETGTAALAGDGEVLFKEENDIAKEHATWLHPAIKRLLEKAKITVRDLEAVAVVAGPGSYTGLRVGMAAAKGLCYALKIPLITRNTLEVMAESMKALAANKAALICPMIDARRDEVFTALYKVEPVIGQPPTLELRRSERTSVIDHRSSVLGQEDLQQILPPQAMILDKNSFEMQLSRNPILFFGNGAAKWKEICSSPSAIFDVQQDTIQAFAKHSHEDFFSKNWADPVYAEPVYLKEFFSY
jgi:tRNA threonylcarbamoyladenosine biosynthesis protein TsaB